MISRPLRAVILEPKPPNPHIFSLYALPRLGGVLLATLLHQRGWDVQVFVEEVADIDFDQVLKADLVGISTITSTAPRAYALADEIRKSGIPVVLGGPHVTFLPDEGLEHADMVVRGEGEVPILALAQSFEGDHDLSQVPGLSWRTNGRTVHNPVPEKLVDLNDLPPPDLSLIHGYKKKNSLASRVIPIQTTRGCPYGCDFCSVTGMFGRKLRRQNPKSVVKMLEGYRHLGRLAFIYDDNFTADKTHAREICRLIIEAALDMDWSTQVRLEAARDTELLEHMYEAGCRTVFIGFESVNQRALAESRKSQSVAEMAGAVRAFRRAGIDVHGMFIYGLESEGSRDLEATLKFALNTPITTAQFLILTPFPGTEQLDRLTREDRILLTDWSLYDGHHVVFAPGNISPQDLQSMQVRSHWRFYSWARSLVSLLKLKFVRTSIYIYARRINSRWHRQNRIYLQVLKHLSRSSSIASNAELKSRFPDISHAVKKARRRMDSEGIRASSVSLGSEVEL
ncbi:B12-binding domain-containing radical SAM protein [bacterium]|nr:B12-binding domain-containing radical SAM protein [bacterium]